MRPCLILSAILLCLLSNGSVSAMEAVGFRQLSLADTDVMIWYPTQDQAPISTVGENRVFYGVNVIENASVTDTDLPLVILSHGYSGLWRNQAWLAAYLAKAGFIAVSFNHAGTSFPDMNPQWARNLAQRPKQVSAIISALLAHQTFGPRLDTTRISVIGHSLGASTALFLAGGIFDPSRLLNACGNSHDKMVCEVYRKGGLAQDMVSVEARDPRISSIVMLDMEGIQAFTPDSLSTISIPVLALVSGVEDPVLPLAWEGRQQASLLPTKTSRYSEIIGATHFSFMSLCKPGAIELLEEEDYVCTGETAPRDMLHQQIAQTIITFLTSGKQMVSALQAL